jgi:anionic cell wall polymer biosynthesis LytR-Cps2A-Psr (LCP) family protein
VESLTGVEVEHYVVVDMAGFDRISTAIGGVPVCLRQSTRDPLSGASFSAGQQAVSGATALAFVRQRRGLPNGDLDRIARLQAFLHSLASKVLTGPALTDVRALTTVLAAVRDNVHTDPGWTSSISQSSCARFTPKPSASKRCPSPTRRRKHPRVR